MLVLWPEIWCRDLSLVCITWPVIKLVSLYVTLFKVTVSKNPVMLIEDLLCLLL